MKADPSGIVASPILRASMASDPHVRALIAQRQRARSNVRLDLYDDLSSVAEVLLPSSMPTRNFQHGCANQYSEARTHGELVNQRFDRELKLLIPLRTGLANVERVVDAEGAISYGANVYELPRGYRRRELIVRDDGRRLRVFADGALVYEHVLLEGSNQRARRQDIHLLHQA